MPAMRILLGTVLLLGLIQKGLAREVDQFLAWGVELEDAGPTIDAYMRKHMADALKDINENRVREIPSGKNRSKKREEIPMEYFSCTTIAHDMMKKAFFQPTYQLIEEYLDNDPAIDRYPRRPSVEADDVRRDRGETVERGYMTDMEYLANSVVQKSPINTPLSRIVNAYGIYTGSDKFGHFTSFGVRYLDQMRDNILNGMNYDDAFFDIMESGYGSEQSVVGMMFTGVFSRGDLEANYQGLVFTFDLCQADAKVRLNYDGRGWELLNLDQFTMRDYVNPNWDESWNSSIYSEKRWDEHVTRMFEERGYCETLYSPWVVKQRALYKERDVPSLNMAYGEAWLPQNFPEMAADEHSLVHYCSNR